MRQKNGREREIKAEEADKQVEVAPPWGDRRELDTFKSRVDWTDARTLEAASAAPIDREA